MSIRPNPTTTMPITAPERKATCSPRFNPSLAACAVRFERAGRGFHADVTAEAGEKAAGQEGDRHERILDMEQREHRENQDEEQR